MYTTNAGANKAYLYRPAGTPLKTISLANCKGNCDDLEYIPVGASELIENHGDNQAPADTAFDGSKSR